MRAGSQDDWTTTPARFDFVDTYFGRDDEVTRGQVNDYLDRIEVEAIIDALNKLILKLNRPLRQRGLAGFEIEELFREALAVDGVLGD